MGEYLPRPGPTIVGRKDEQDRLGALLGSVAQGNGAVALVSGEAGIGKTTLVRDLSREATERGWVVLQGGCYDLTTTPPYGPWAEVVRSYPAARDSLPDLPDQIQRDGGIAGVGSQFLLFETLHEFFGEVSEHLPLLLVLEDLHWSDPASLELLRFLGRNSREQRMLLLVTYRDDELSPEHELARILPALVRESQPERLHLTVLDSQAISEYIANRYDLESQDFSRLVDHLRERADGNPFFASEILQDLEDEQLLRRTGAGWQLGDIDTARVPALLRQVVNDRLARLRAETRAALQIAAVIGQEIRLGVWEAVSELDASDLDEVMTEALQAHLIEEAPSGTALQFRHALIREALYESLTLGRRRVWHRRIGEALAGLPDPEPDSVAHHFQHARDPRAETWLIRAGEQAQHAYAWKTASERFDQALQWIGEDSDRAFERAWLLYRAGRQMRHYDHARARSYLEQANRLASALGDDVLSAYALFDLGSLRWLSGDMRRGLEEMASGDDLLDRLPADHAPPGSAIAAWTADALPVEELGQTPKREPDATSAAINARHGLRIAFCAHVGQIELARNLGEDYLRRVATVQKPSALLLGSIGDAYNGMLLAEATAGHPRESWRWFDRSLRVFQSIDHHFMISLIARLALYEVGLTYDATDLTARERLIRVFERAHQQSLGAHSPDLPAAFGKLPVLLLEGSWSEAREVAGIAAGLDLDGASALVVRAMLAEIALYQGDATVVEEQVQKTMPEGPETEPGDCYFLAGLHLQRIACSLALDWNDLGRARNWAEVHDRWLAWNGAVLGQAEGQLLWARYHQLAGDRDAAQTHAETALQQASDPRQPRVLLAAHRFLGSLAAQQRRFSASEEHLSQTLDLAQQCRAPYERALTLLELVDLRLKQSRLRQARLYLNEARNICIPLEAVPTLARVDELARRIEASAIDYPDGLTPREVDVLRLIAAGRSNRDMAEELFLSIRTVERHVANIYGKIDAHNRQEATSYAEQHGLVSQ